MQMMRRRGQYHQPIGAKRKCALQFHQLNYAQLYQYTQLEFTLKFKAVHFMLCISKIGINLLAQKLPLEC